MATQGACYDYINYYTNGLFTVNNSAPALLYALGDKKSAAALASLILAPYAYNHISCTLQTYLHLPAPVADCVTVVGACAVSKGLNYCYERYQVETPVQLIQKILKEKGLPLLNPDYQELAKKFEGAINLKVEFMLNDLRTRFPQVFEKMSTEDKRKYTETVKEQAVKDLPQQLGSKKDDIVSAVAQSQVPVTVQTRATMLGMQEAGLNVAAFDLEGALANILYGVNTVRAHATPRPL